MSTPLDFLEHAQAELAAMDYDETATGLPRREFMFRSLVAAAASTFGVRAAGAQSPRAYFDATASVWSTMQPPVQQSAVPLGNGEAPALQFMPYPEGTGALMEKMVAKYGVNAFKRSTFTVEPFTGAVPSNPEDLAFLPAHRIAALIKARKITSRQITDIYLERMERLNPTLNCVVTLMKESARAEADAMDKELAAGKYRGPLHGVPYGIKDLFATKNAPTSWGSPDYKDQTHDYDAEIVVRLRNAGAVLLAKLATGLYAQNDWWFGGRTNNPWNTNIGSSGSSAGPGSATAGGVVAFSIGTETQGSIVSPAIRNGISALRPTYGRVSRHGGMVLSWSQDRVGPMCRTAEDCAMVFNVLHGVDPKDASTVTTPFTFDRNIKLASLRIGVDPNAPKELVEKLTALGMTPKTIGARPTVPGMGGGGLNAEYAAAFDSFVQKKAKEFNLDLNALPERPASGPGANGPFGNTPPARPKGINEGEPNPMAAADWNPRFVGGRNTKAFDFINNQRRRLMLVQKWGEFLKDLDGFIGAPNADIGPNAQTGHPCAVLPFKFDVPNFGGGGPRNNDSTPAPTYKAQPICGVITGNLYNDDIILSVAHQFQKATDFHARRPAL
ncbi:amidase [Gemmatimonas phototrophica]|uniref:amidase n=1 Tax=Gemmatimonas phototrophica TaxID=1379270 RepID=UPI000A78E246|nr:amidase [Gemmatimonas phototrophica]